MVTFSASVILSGCDSGDSNSESAEDSAKNAVLTEGMPLNEALMILTSVGATEVDGAYPLFWFADDEWPGGTHTYYHLTDSTCIQLRVAHTEPEKTVVAFGVGPKGKPYTGKLEWFADVKADKVARPSMVTLNPNGEQVGAVQPATALESKSK